MERGAPHAELPELQAGVRAELRGAGIKFAYPSGSRPLSGYTIKRGVGRGGFGEVYYAVSDGGKEVALKLIRRNLDVELRGVRIARAQGLDFGSHVVRLRGGGEKVGIELATLSGPLQLKGGGTWDRTGRVTLSGSAEATNPGLSKFLRSVCAEYREPRCAFHYSRGR